MCTLADFRWFVRGRRQAKESDSGLLSVKHSAIPTGDVDGLGEGVGVGVAVPTGVPTGVGVGGVPVITDNSGLMPLLLLLQVFETSGALKLGIDSPPPIIDTVPVGDTYTTFEFEPLAFAAVQPFPQNIK